MSQLDYDNMTSQKVTDNEEVRTPMVSSKWEDVSNWQSLVTLNKEFIENSQKSGIDKLDPPYNPDFDEDFITRLRSLHDYGLFVTSGQGKKSEKLEKLSGSTGEEYRQRQYLEFFIPQGHTAKRFLECVLQDSQLTGVAFDKGGARLVGSSENNIEVSWSRESADAEWDHTALITATYENDNHINLSKIAVFNAASPMFCAVTTREDEVDLLASIERHAQATGISLEAGEAVESLLEK